MSPMEGHSLYRRRSRRTARDKEGKDWITSLKEGKKSHIIYQCSSRVTEKRTPFRDITDKCRCDRSPTKVHRCHIDLTASRVDGELSRDLDEAKGRGINGPPADLWNDNDALRCDTTSCGEISAANSAPLRTRTGLSVGFETLRQREREKVVLKYFLKSPLMTVLYPRVP